VLPTLAGAGRDSVAAWSAGCASGEEPYTLALLWHEAVAARFPGVRLEILATDVDTAILRRAREATYDRSSLRELPMPWRERGSLRRGGRDVLRAEHRRLVTVRRHELRGPAPAGPFDLVLCRNLAFTYFGCELQQLLDQVAKGAVDEITARPRLVMGSQALRDRLFVRWEQEAALLAPIIAEEAGDDSAHIVPAVVARTLAWTHRITFRAALTRLIVGEDHRKVARDLRKQSEEAYALLEAGPRDYGR
jgi:hypothetical protein